jgi:ribosomal protein S18 acetylase RimI-like enzyme
MIKAKTIKLVGYDSKYATAVVTMWRASKENALGRVENHSFDDHLYYLNEVLAKDNTIYLAVFEDNETVAGLMATDGVFLNQLYIHTECQREGVGSRLLDLAKTLSSGKLQLYTFEMNSGAQNFFEKHGFKMAGRGSDNEEQLPDILYEWCKVGSNAT